MTLGKDDTIPEFNGNKECAWAAMTEAQDPEVDMNCAVEAKPAPMEDHAMLGIPCTGPLVGGVGVTCHG